MSFTDYVVRWQDIQPTPRGIYGRVRTNLRSVCLDVAAILNKAIEDEFLRCIYCHNVFDDQKSRFAELIERLQKIGKFVDTATCIQMLRGEKQIDGRYFHLSFDDGFRNNFTNAVPILKDRKVPALFFVPSSLIQADFLATRKYCLETARYSAVIETLRWNDLSQMVEAGFEIGSHTRTHVRFSEVSSNRVLMEDEIAGSKKDLEDRLGVECKYISWPYGRHGDADNTSLEMVRQAGYTACFGAFRGTVHPGLTEIWRIPRHQVEIQWPFQHSWFFARGNMERRA